MLPIELFSCSEFALTYCHIGLQVTIGFYRNNNQNRNGTELILFPVSFFGATVFAPTHSMLWWENRESVLLHSHVMAGQLVYFSPNLPVLLYCFKLA